MNNLNLSALSLPHFDNLIIKPLPNAEYTTTHEQMFSQTLNKIEHKKSENPLPDELWLVEHQDVYTLGQAGKKEHILYDNGTPIIQTDRGGQVTWHGTGQLVAYFLWDLNALNFGVRDLVSHAEQAIEDVVNFYLPDTLVAKARKDAPGVYIYNTDGDMLGKIASLGFKIKHGHSYHGIAINLINDLSAFNAINPCGYAGMTMVKLAQFCEFNTDEFILKLIDNLVKRRSGEIKLR
ncbi:MAG: lipoyl(octanoyl) transferase LipB [Moraxella sp.]|uniref:lipoyl(octanoyl) transferase LipB n=1 Tax=Moraxella sp. TaxID=479 RepID=UPI0026DD9ACF|nr:lipoyl(octanoyl) transferase LipB [Moraxella sp.]MDO4450794.1 lipoyl(octanoyl) transferase LipB [Moraxella sp.]